MDVVARPHCRPQEALRGNGSVSAAYARARQIGEGVSEPALRWLALGELGQSSLAMFQRLAGLRLVLEARLPLDTDDFTRCRKLLEAVPELVPRLGELASISPGWAALVAGWAELCATMDAEAPRWREGVGRTPRTYELLKQLDGLDLHGPRRLAVADSLNRCPRRRPALAGIAAA